jgi:hypothetical protein
MKLALVVLLFCCPLSFVTGAHAQDKTTKKAEKLCAKHTDWSLEACKAIVAHDLRIGMTAEQVKASWGNPDRIEPTITEGHVQEQWTYMARFVGSRYNSYVHFTDRKLDVIQPAFMK